MSTFSNPLLGILAGAGFTAVIQSSSASVGILQALANSGVIGLPSAVFVLFGQNIGTCITAVLASIGTTATPSVPPLSTCMFNVIGTVILPFCSLSCPIAYVIDGFPDLPGSWDRPLRDSCLPPTPDRLLWCTPVSTSSPPSSCCLWATTWPRLR